MPKALDMDIERSLKKAKGYRVCVRCNHLEPGCNCKNPVWVEGSPSNLKADILSLRNLPFKKVKRMFRTMEVEVHD